MRQKSWFLPLIGALALACSVPIASNMDEAQANQAVVVLEEQGVAATKASDQKNEGRFQVSVAPDDVAAAASVLTRESLPAINAPGVLDALGRGSIVPSRMAEHAKLIAGTAGELERSLNALEGVLSARVHLAVPEADPFGDGETEKDPSASVLLRHRGATPPIAERDVQRLVSGAVPDLAEDRVSVVLTGVPTPARPPERELARFGPISVSRASVPALRSIVVGIAALDALLIAFLIALWLRAKRALDALDALRAAAPSGGGAAPSP